VEFDWSDEQSALRDAVRRLVRAKAPLSTARTLAEAGQRSDPAFWREIAGAGLLGLPVPEEFGGAGASLVELTIVAEEFGRALVGGPFLATAVLGAHALLAVAADPAAADHLAALMGGELTVALAVIEDRPNWDEDEVQLAAQPAGAGTFRLTGHKRLVLDGAGADLLLVAARTPIGVSLFAVPSGTGGVTATPLTSLDLTREVADINFADAPAQLLGKEGAGWAAVERAMQAGMIVVAGEQVGGSASTVEITAEYARTRSQFGRKIGQFQGVKHRLADMAVRTDLARSAAYWAAWQVPGSDLAAMGSGVAASLAAESYLQNAQDMIQLHGGIGFTWEHDSHLFLRRARSTHSLFGAPSRHRDRLLGQLIEESAGV
jgi:alkylation response protein AidB-like acyl-CoA dehydrogenase